MEATLKDRIGQYVDENIIRSFLGMEKIKYSALNELFQDTGLIYEIPQYKEICMYLDAHCIFSRLLREPEYVIVSATEQMLIRNIVVGFFNVLAHYRRYLATRLKKRNSIYVLFNTEQPDYNTSMIPSFNWRIYLAYHTDAPDESYITHAIEQAWNFILKLSPYFEGIYCLTNQGVDNTAVIRRFGFDPETFYIIYAKSKYPMQLIQKNVVQLHSNRDNSKLITLKNVYTDGAYRTVSKNKKVIADASLVPSQLPLLWTLCGCSDVSVEPAKHVRQMQVAIRIANEMVQANELHPDTSIQSFLEHVSTHIRFVDKRRRCPPSLYIKVDYPLFIKRYKGLSADLSAAAITHSQWEQIQTQIYDIYDENALEELNQVLAEVTIADSNADILQIENLNLSEAQYYE